MDAGFEGSDREGEHPPFEPVSDWFLEDGYDGVVAEGDDDVVILDRLPDGTAAGLATPDEVRQELLDEVGSAVNVIRELPTGRSGQYEAHDMTSVLSELAEDALASGDTAAYENYLDALGNVGFTFGAKAARAYLAGIDLENEKARQALDGALEAEKISVKDALANPLSGKDDFAGLLHGVVGCREDQDMPADDMIEKYAASPEQRWAISFEHHKALADKSAGRNTDEAEERRQKLAATAVELTSSGFKPSFILEHMGTALTAAGTPAEKVTMYDQFIEYVAGAAPLTDHTFGQLVRVAEAIIKDPELATNERVEIMDCMINDAAQILDAHDGWRAGFTIARKKIGWHAEVARRNGDGPQAILDAINHHTRLLMLNARKDIGDDFMVGSQGDAADSRDWAISSQVGRYIEQGDAASARFLFGNMASPDRMDDALEKAISKITSVETLSQFRPSPEFFELYPDFKLHFDFAEARLAADTAAMGLVAQAALKTFRQSDSQANRRYVTRAYEFVKERDPVAATDLAKSLVTIYRALDCPYTIYREMSFDLIASGDAEEMVAAQHELQYENRRLSLVWGIARALNRNTGVAA